LLSTGRPYFKRSEGFTAPGIETCEEHATFFSPESHGTGGPLQTVYSKEFGESHKHWHSTFHNLGVETNKSHFSGSNIGVWTSLTAVEPNSRVRSYSANSYYLPNSKRPNLTVLTEATALEIILEKEDSSWRATGVRFEHGGKAFSVAASKEVILSAGSVQSPQMLELSGIGNPEILNEAGVNVKVANPNVGENLQEHMSRSLLPSFLSLFRLTDPQ
jgi:choline dehydrogenase-like flavoprotein